MQAVEFKNMEIITNYGDYFSLFTHKGNFLTKPIYAGPIMKPINEEFTELNLLGSTYKHGCVCAHGVNIRKYFYLNKKKNNKHYERPKVQPINVQWL